MYLRAGVLEYWVSLDTIEEQKRQSIATKSPPNMDHQHRKERNDMAHGGSILVDSIVLSEYLTKYAASDMESASTQQAVVP